MPVEFDLSQNYFGLFGLPASFDLDNTALTQAYRQLQKDWHPDRFALEADADKRRVMQAAAMINEAYQTLSRPVSRARYLLEHAGQAINLEKDTQQDPIFLMEQMEMREALDDAVDVDALDQVAEQVKQRLAEVTDSFRQAYARQALLEAKTQWQKMLFLDKLQQQIKLKEESLDVF